MDVKKIISYIFPLLLSVLIFISNFLDTDIFSFGNNNFAVWFVLSTFAFACGWQINKSFNWTVGGKIVFALTIATSIISFLIVAFFKEYFSASDFVTESILLFVLRNVLLGAFGFFGMSISEIFALSRANEVLSAKLKVYEDAMIDSKKEAELIVREALLKAKKIVLEAELNAKNLFLKKERIERELKEFIQIEKELIKKYEE